MKGVFKMKTKTNLKVVKNKNSRVKSSREEKAADTAKITALVSTVVSFILVAKVKLCFRECAKIVKIAEETDCFVEIASGTKSGTSESILSLVNLGITNDKSLVLTIKGERNDEAFRRISKIINGTEEE